MTTVMQLNRNNHFTKNVLTSIFVVVKYFGVAILTCLFLMQILSSSLLVLNYEMNTAYIIENFCENTDKPELKCDGKCHLNKQIQADSEQKSETPAALTEIAVFVLAVQEISTFDFTVWNSDSNPCNSLYLQGNYSNYLQSIFRPPQV